MFIALWFKEWREKALVFVFALGLLVLLLGAQFFVASKDLREWLVYAVLLLFFPLAALLLGSAGFEAEYRQGAWAYLFSRPVSRVMVWLAKFGAVISMFAVLWLVFVGAWAALPAIRSLAAGPREILEFIAADGFPWWSLGLSAFLLVVAFSLSLIHERQLQLMFLSLVLGLSLLAAAWGLTVTRAAGFMAWLDPAKALRTLLIGLVLMAVTFIGASLRTLVRSDFSQPRSRTRTFVGWFVPLLILALAMTVATALWLPMPGEYYLSVFATSDTKAFYSTERGIFSYDSTSGLVRRLAGSKHRIYFGGTHADGRLVYSTFNMIGRREAVQEIWVVNADGTGRKRIIGPDSPAPWRADTVVRDVMISPDGRKIAMLTLGTSSRGSRATDLTLWTVNTDGSGLERLPAEFVPSDGMTSVAWSYFVAWERQRDALIFQVVLENSSSKPSARSLWRYDLGARTATRVRDNAGAALRRVSTRPEGDLLVIKYPMDTSDPPTKLALLNLSTLEETEIAEGGPSISFNLQWDPAGERLSLERSVFGSARSEGGGQERHVLAIYSIPERKTIAERIIAPGGSGAGTLYTSWMQDGRSLVALERERRSLIILGPDLQETGRFDLPARIKEPWGPAVVGNQILIEDSEADSLWRLDLATKRWKRIS